MKIKRLLNTIVCTTIVFLFSCEDAIKYDKEIRLPFSFPFNGIEGFGTEASILSGNIFLRNFNKKNYPQLKSISFSAFLIGADPDQIIVELYNETDGVVIQNSLISTSSTEYAWVDSQDILNSLPNKEINLTLSIRSTATGGGGGIYDAMLILKRD